MAGNQSPVQVNISSLTIVKVVLVIFGLLFFYAIRSILAMVFVAWVLSSALDPWINWLHRYKIPRGVSILSVYVAAAAVLTLSIILLVPPVTNELNSITQNLPSYYGSLRQSLEGIKQTSSQYGLLSAVQQGLDHAAQSINTATSGIYDAVSSVLSGIVTLIGILVIAFYLTVDEDGLKKFISSLTPVSYQPYIIHKVSQIQKRLSGWLGGQLLLMVFVGTLTGVSLWILGVKYSLVLGILAGIFEIVPVIGPVLSAVPAIFFAFTDYTTAPYKPFIVLIMFVLIQQVENQFLVPRVMKRAVGLNPIIIIVSLLIGARLGGLLGVLLAVPSVAILDVFLQDFLADKQREQNRLEE